MLIKNPLAFKETTVVVLDEFSYADGYIDTVTGDVWKGYKDSAGVGIITDPTQPVISSGDIRRSVSGNSYAIRNVSYPLTYSYSILCNVTGTIASVAAILGICVRMDTPIPGNFLTACMRLSAGDWYAELRQNQLGNFATLKTVATGFIAFSTIELIVDGDDFEFKVDGATQYTHNSAAYNTKTGLGLQIAEVTNPFPNRFHDWQLTY